MFDEDVVVDNHETNLRLKDEACLEARNSALNPR